MNSMGSGGPGGGMPMGGGRGTGRGVMGGPGGRHLDFGPGGPRMGCPGGGATVRNINQQSGACAEIAGGAPPNPHEKNFIVPGNLQQVMMESRARWLHAEQLMMERACGMIAETIPLIGPKIELSLLLKEYAEDDLVYQQKVDRTASKGESNPPVAGAASKRFSEDCGESPREKRRASTTAFAEDMSLTDEDGRSPLHLAAGEGDVERARELIGRFADTRLRDRRGMTPLHRALDKSEGEALRDYWGMTPLHPFLDMAKEEVAQLLAAVDCGNDIQGEDGRTPLHLAAAEGCVTIVRKLLDGGSRTRVLDKRGMTPLHRALDRKKLAAAELLADADCEIDCQDDRWRTPLFLAAGVGYVKIVRKLLAAGSRLRVQDKLGRTPLHHALQWERVAAAEILTEADGGNDVSDGAGQTPLHLALWAANPPSEYEGIARKLLESGAKPHVKDRHGMYPIQRALRRRRNGNITTMLLSSCALKGVTIDWEELRLGEKDLQFCIEKFSRCDAEIHLMRRTRVPGSSISHHHLVTRHVIWVASRLRTGYVRSVSRQDFPVYADLLSSELRMAEQRRDLMDRCLECFSLLSPPIPRTCVDIVLLCLGDGDMANFVRAILLVQRSCHECGAHGTVE